MAAELSPAPVDLPAWVRHPHTKMWEVPSEDGPRARLYWSGLRQGMFLAYVVVGSRPVTLIDRAPPGCTRCVLAKLGRWASCLSAADGRHSARVLWRAVAKGNPVLPYIS